MVQERRKARCVMATDSEWHEIQAAAEVLQMTTSRFVIERSLLRERQDSGMDMSDIVLDIFRDVRMLVTITEDNMRHRGDNDRFDDIQRRIERHIASLHR